MRIAILDSGVTLPPPSPPVAARAAFVLSEGMVVSAAPHPDRIGHGGAVAAIVQSLVPTAALLDAQIFDEEPTTSAAVVAAGLRWAVEQGARLATMSFGLPSDRAVLRAAVQDALDAGVLLVAARPARGGPVWPAAYPGVIAATGDARCAPGELSILPGAYGACPRRCGDDSAHPRTGGASLAVGHLAGLLARLAPMDRAEAVAQLDGLARWRGPERRTAHG
jgi:hypothetical protein